MTFQEAKRNIFILEQKLHKKVNASRGKIKFTLKNAKRLVNGLPIKERTFLTDYFYKIMVTRK